MSNALLRRYAFSICAAALLAGCGGSQPPIGAPGAMPQANAEASSSSYEVLHRFAGVRGNRAVVPLAGLISVSGTLYGTTGRMLQYGCVGSHCSGTIFSMSTNGAKKLIYQFEGGASDGAQPTGHLLDVNGTLYGTTALGGGSGCGGEGCGTVYSVTPSGSEKVLYSFKGGTDGADPTGDLLDANGTLYGTTVFGGKNVDCGTGYVGCGTVYSVTTSGSERVLHAFAGIPDGGSPVGGFVDVNGTLFGATTAGGKACGTHLMRFRNGCGTVYSVSTSGSETVLHRFQVSDGIGPRGGLLDVNGTLYGTASGNNIFAGTVYKISTVGAYKVVYRFQGAPDGANPYAPLIEANGMLYGTTYLGGTHCQLSQDEGCGTIFGVTKTGKETVLYSFTGRPDGYFPIASLANVKGRLYGTTPSGGRIGCDQTCGVVFALSP